MHNVLSGTSSVVQCSSSKGTIWKSSSSSRHTGVLAGVVLGVGGASSEVSLSLCELNDNCLHTGLDGVCSALRGMTGSGLNEAFLMLDTWRILSVFLSGVGKLMVSEPLS